MILCVKTPCIFSLYKFATYKMYVIVLIHVSAFSMRELLHSYGFEHMPLLYNLEKAGLVKGRESRSNWAIIRRGLQLIVDIKDPEKY